MTPRRAPGTLIFVAFATGLLAACGSPSRDPVTLHFWAMGREGEVVERLVPDFEREHPGIHVEVQQLPWSAAHEKLLTAFAGDSTPDLCQLGNTWIPEFVAIRALERLDGRVAGSPSIAPADYFPGIWNTNVVSGALYGVPWYVDTRLLFYRRDLLLAAGFEAPPRDWREWQQMLAAVKASVGPARYSILLPVNEPEPLLALALQQEDPLLRDNGRFGNFQSPGFERALAFYLTPFARGWAPAATGADIANVWSEFGRGYFSFYISGPWNIGEFERRLPQDQQANWMTAPLPGPAGPGASIAGGASLVVFRASRAKDAAWQLVEYLSRPAIQRTFHALTGDLPPRRSAWSEGNLADDIHARAFRDQLERVKPAPQIPEWERVVSAMQEVTERAVHGDLTVAAAAREIDARTDAILEKRRWLLSREAGQ
jgi:multiple sugar transport system substrate-binding protein